MKIGKDLKEIIQQFFSLFYILKKKICPVYISKEGCSKITIYITQSHDGASYRFYYLPSFRTENLSVAWQSL